MSDECGRRNRCHANCTPGWWCFVKAFFHAEPCAATSRHDLEQSVVAKVLDDPALGEVPLDQKIRQIGGL